MSRTSDHHLTITVRPEPGLAAVAAGLLAGASGLAMLMYARVRAREERRDGEVPDVVDFPNVVDIEDIRIIRRLDDHIRRNTTWD